MNDNPLREDGSVIIYTYDQNIFSFKREIIGSDLLDKIIPLFDLSSEDLYWLKKENIPISKAKEFLLTASTWPRRFGNSFRVEAELSSLLKVSLLEADKDFLSFDITWLTNPALIKEIYSPLGFVQLNNGLYFGVSPEYLQLDLHESGIKVFRGERLTKFLQNEWPLLKPFALASDEKLKTLLLPQSEIVLSKDLVNSIEEISLSVSEKRLTLKDIPNEFSYYDIIETKVGFLSGEQLAKAGIRPFKRYFTGYPLHENPKEKVSDFSNKGFKRVQSPYDWFYDVKFMNLENASDIMLVGDASFTYLARQLVPSFRNDVEVIKVIREIKDAVSTNNCDRSFKNYVDWREDFVTTTETNQEALYCLIFMQEMINELFESTRGEKQNLFWPLWQCVAKYGSREVKGRFIEAALDWSLIEGYYNIYGYMSTLKNGYMHNALLWQAFLPENREDLEPAICAELALESLNRGIFEKRPELIGVVPLVFGKVDNYYRQTTDASFLASFHSPYFTIKEYSPYKDQIYTGFIGKVIVAELSPLVLHQPLVQFAKDIFNATSLLLTSSNLPGDIQLDQKLIEIISETIKEANI